MGQAFKVKNLCGIYFKSWKMPRCRSIYYLLLVVHCNISLDSLLIIHFLEVHCTCLLVTVPVK